MPFVRLTWTDNSTGEDGYRIYRDLLEINLGDLPTPLVELDPDTISYDDMTVSEGETYHYALSAYKGTEELFAPQVTVTVEPTPIFIENFENLSLENHALNYLQNRTTNGRRAISWDVVGNPTDVEVLAKLGISKENDRFGILVRGAGSSGSESGYVLQTNSNGSFLSLLRYSSGSATTVVPLEGSSSGCRRVWLRLRLEGNNQYSKIWLDGEEEPLSWQHSTTDSGLSDSGFVGLFSFDGRTTATAKGKYCLYYSVGVDGATAPNPGEALGADQYRADFSQADALDDWTFRWSSVGVSASIETEATDLPPIGWNSYWLDMGFATLSNGNMTITQPGSTRRKALFWTSIGKIQDCDVVASLRVSNNINNRQAIRVRGSGAAGSESAYYIELNSQLGLALRQYPSADTLDTAPFSTVSNDQYWMRMNIKGNLIRGKVWNGGTLEEPEPSGWMVSATDTSIQDEGFVGFGDFSGNINQLIHCDYFAVSLDPDVPAPIPTEPL